jgi:hypothetical protein
MGRWSQFNDFLECPPEDMAERKIRWTHLTITPELLKIRRKYRAGQRKDAKEPAGME